MHDDTKPAPDDLLSVEEAADALDRSPRLVWNLVRDYELPRYRVPARGKVTLLRWEDIERAYHTPRPASPRAAKKAAA
jgi:hypothetical protein